MTSKKRLIPSQQISNFTDFSQRVDVSKSTSQIYSGYLGNDISFFGSYNDNGAYIVVSPSDGKLYRIFSYTTPGEYYFDVDAISTSSSEGLQIFMCGGGGGGGGYSPNTITSTYTEYGSASVSCGGGGGGGEFRVLKDVKLKPGRHKIIIGQGGQGGSINQDGSDGSDTIVANIVARGGKGGKAGTSLKHGDGGASGSGQPGGLGDSYAAGGGGGSRSPGLNAGYNPNMSYGYVNDNGGAGGVGPSYNLNYDLFYEYNQVLFFNDSYLYRFDLIGAGGGGAGMYGRFCKWGI